MSIDREQSEPCPQVLLSRSPRAVPGNPSLRGRQIFPAEWGRRGCGVKRWKVNQHLSMYLIFSPHANSRNYAAAGRCKFEAQEAI